MRFAHVTKRIGLVLLVVFLFLGLGLVFLQTNRGRRLVADSVAKVLSGSISGTIKIDRIGGNVFNRLALKGVSVDSRDGRRLLSVERIDLRYKITKFFSPHVVVRELVLRHPVAMVMREGAVLDWQRLFKISHAREKTADRNKTLGESFFELHRIIVVNGDLRLDELRPIERRVLIARVGPINADLSFSDGFPARFESLPVGRVIANGRIRDLPLRFFARLAEPVSVSAQALSGILKSPIFLRPKVPRVGLRQEFVVQAALGRSDLRCHGAAALVADNPLASPVDIVITQFKYAGDELNRRFAALPKVPAVLNGYFRADLPFVETSLNATLDHRVRVALQGAAETKGVKKIFPVRAHLAKLSVSGQCPVLELARPAELSVVEGEPFPYGKADFRGCAGPLHYERTKRGALAFVAKELQIRPLFGFLASAGMIKSRSVFEGQGTVGIEISVGMANRSGVGKVTWRFKETVESGGKSGIDTAGALVARLDKRTLKTELNASFSGENIRGAANVSDLVSATGWGVTPSRAAGSLRLETSVLDLKRLTRLALPSIPLSGQASLKVVLNGTLRRLAARISGKAQNVTFLSSVDAEPRPDAPRLSADASLTYLSGIVDLRADLGPQSPSPSITRNDGRFVIRATTQIPSTNFFSNRVVPLHPALRASLIEWNVKSNGFDIAPFLPGSRYANQVKKVMFWLDAGGKGSMQDMSARADGDLRSEDGKIAEVHARIDGLRAEARLLAHEGVLDPVLPVFGSEIVAHGAVLNADLRAVAEAGKVDYSGFLKMAARRLHVLSIATEYNDVVASFHGAQDVVRLDELSAKSRHGTLRGAGILDLKKGKEPQAVELTATFDNFDLLASDKIGIQTSGDLAITANRLDSSFAGTLNVTSGQVTLPGSEDKTLEPLGEMEDVVYERRKSEQGLSQGLFHDLHGTIEAKAPGHLWLKSEDQSLVVELDARLQLGLDNQSDFYLTGTVDTVRGYADFFGRRFEIRQGQAEFLGDPTEPRIHAQALYKSSPYSILVDLNGIPPDLKPKLSSDPPELSEEQAIGVLLTGSPDYQRKGGGGSVGGIATGFLVGQLKSRLGSALPFDTFTAQVAPSQTNAVTAQNAQDSTSGRTQVEVGKYISDRIFLKVGRVFGTAEEEPVNRVTLDYRLSERWSIETTQTDQGRSDLDVIWLYSY